MKRPMLWMFGFLLVLFLTIRFRAKQAGAEPDYLLDACFTGPEAQARGLYASVQGTLYRTEPKTKVIYYYLKDTSVSLKDTGQNAHFSDLLILVFHDTAKTSTENNETFLPGNTLSIKGMLQCLERATNPGQFDEKSYYREKNIYYKLTAQSIQCINPHYDRLQYGLGHIRDRLQGVYQSCLPLEDSGILSAMLLGEKSLLDREQKELYTASGIGHLLAISGLHITLLCTVFYGLLSRLYLLPRPVPLAATLAFLIGYGMMTGFGISTNRAVIMMCFSLMAGCLGRSYDAWTAMSCSAIVILLQKPYAIFSCSFLLSYSATAGLLLILPLLQSIIEGSGEERDRKKRRKKQRQKEFLANHTPFVNIVYQGIQYLLKKSGGLLLASTSIWLATLPVMLYFFYELPTYGILINLLVLSLAPVLMVSAFAGGAAGLLFLPAARLLLLPAHWILLFYQKICTLSLRLPSPIQVFGRPQPYQILLYYGILAAALYTLRLSTDRQASGRQGISLFLVIFSICLLCRRPLPDGLQVTLLDVGQGDCILIRTDTGKNILVDGGSSSVSQVGRYRILPFLKYHGISTIDYMIVSHEDADHISGQLELLEAAKQKKILIGCCLLPEPSRESTGEGYASLLEKAAAADVPTGYIHKGDSLRLGNLSLDCLHPERGFPASSANAYSTTLSLRYGSFSMLLTGDLEKEGETALFNELQKKAPAGGYTVLKVAHHGSKHSTSQELLALLSPKISLISCGKNNRYGHPHKELTNRLAEAGSTTLQTDRQGAVSLKTDGQTLSLTSWIED